MGTHYTADVIEGSTMKEAFELARSEAQIECGSGGYTGTIAEAHSFTPYSHVRSQGLSNAEANIVLDTHVEKYSPTLISPIIDTETLSKSTQTHTVSIPSGKSVDEVALEFYKTHRNDLVIISYYEIDVTKKVAGKVPEVTTGKSYIVTLSGEFSRRVYETLSEAKKAARDAARRGLKATLTTQEKIIFEPITQRETKLEVKTKKILKSTRSQKNRWFALGAYSE